MLSLWVPTWSKKVGAPLHQHAASVTCNGTSVYKPFPSFPLANTIPGVFRPTNITSLQSLIAGITFFIYIYNFCHLSLTGDLIFHKKGWPGKMA